MMKTILVLAGLLAISACTSTNVKYQPEGFESKQSSFMYNEKNGSATICETTGSKKTSHCYQKKGI